MLNFFASTWTKWLKLAEILGNIQLTIFLSVLYLAVIPFWAVPLKLFSDRLALRNATRARWIKRVPSSNRFDAMRKQG